MSKAPTREEVFGPTPGGTTAAKRPLGERIEEEVFAALREGVTRFEVEGGAPGSPLRNAYTEAHEDVISKLVEAGFEIKRGNFRGSGWWYEVS